jgi:catalase
MVLLRPNHAGDGCREGALRSLRPDQGLAALDYPLIQVGILELNRNLENYFAEVEQAAFEQSNVVPEHRLLARQMLQFRIFAYADAHRYRLGSPDYKELPVNKARCAV